MTLPRCIRGITIYSSYNLTKYIFLIISFKSQNNSLIHVLQNGHGVSRHENSIHLVVFLSFFSCCVSLRDLLGDQVHRQRAVTFLNNFFFF